MNGVKEIVGRILVDFGYDAGASVFPMIAFEAAAEVEFLADGEFFGEAEDAAVAADEQSFGGLREHGAFWRGPGGLDGHTEADAVTLAEAV
jgi:hypothetical protein